jgi:hypothetical protein
MTQTFTEGSHDRTEKRCHPIGVHPYGRMGLRHSPKGPVLMDYG